MVTVSSTIKRKLDDMHLPVFYKELKFIPRNVMLKVNLKELMEIYEETMIQVSEEPVNNISKPKILKKDNNN